MKKFVFFFSLFAHISLTPFALTLEERIPKLSPAQEVYNTALRTGNKVFNSVWPYEFNDKDNLYSKLSHVNMEEKKEVTKRYQRMIHVPYLNSEQTEKMINRIEKFSENVPALVSFIENKISNYYGTHVSVQHLSIYGSYLYNAIDPEDVDLMIVVDSPKTIFEHLEFPAFEVLGFEKGELFPKMSFQVMDYNTYLYAKEQIDGLSRGEKLAQQQLTLAGCWYFTIYGFDLRFDPPKSLKKYMLINYLNKAFNTLNGAGQRLYKNTFSYLPDETGPVRLRKVVSRLLITDYVLSVLEKSYTSSPKTFEQLYNEIRPLKEDEHEKLKLVSEKIEKLYLEKLRSLLKLAEKYKKLNNLDSNSY